MTKRKNRYNEKFKINATFDEVLKVTINDKQSMTIDTIKTELGEATFELNQMKAQREHLANDLAKRHSRQLEHSINILDADIEQGEILIKYLKENLQKLENKN